jgi:hypothetical protein
MLEDDLIISMRDRISIYVNHRPVPLTLFPTSIITKTISGMLSSLKGVVEMESVQINLRASAHNGKGGVC